MVSLEEIEKPVVAKPSESQSLQQRSKTWAAFKQYSTIANRTLTNFANEMSEILRDNIEQLDCINLMVRGCMYDMEHPPKFVEAGKIGDNISNINNSLQRIKNQVVHQSSLLKPIEEVSRTVLEVAKPKRKSGICSKTSSAASFVHGYRKSTNDMHMLEAIKKESSVLNAIHKKRNNIKKKKKKSKKEKKSNATDKILEEKLNEKIESSLKILRENFARTKKWSEHAIPISFGDSKPKGTLLQNTTFKENTKSKEMKNTKLQRKYANENFHDNAKRERPALDDVFPAGKKIKIVTENANDCCIIMHTQKGPPKTDIKPSYLSFSKILDDLTPKDLEPLKAEYPRKDNILKEELPNLVTLLDRLVKGNTNRLQYLVDVNALDNVKVGSKRCRRSMCDSRTTCYTIPEEESTEQTRVRLKKKEKKFEEDDKKLPKKEMKKRLRKYMVDSGKVHKQEIVVMPVMVKYYKEDDIAKLAKSARNNKLDAYIYSEDDSRKSGSSNDYIIEMVKCPTTEQIPPKQRPKKLMLKLEGMPTHTDDMTCDYKKETPLIKQLSNLSVVCNDAAGSFKKEDTKSNRGRKLPAVGEIKTKIEELEKKLAAALANPGESTTSTIRNIELEIKTILSNMQFDVDTSEVSVTTSSTSTHGDCSKLLEVPKIIQQSEGLNHKPKTRMGKVIKTRQVELRAPSPRNESTIKISKTMEPPVTVNRSHSSVTQKASVLSEMRICMGKIKEEVHEGKKATKSHRVDPLTRLERVYQTPTIEVPEKQRSRTSTATQKLRKDAKRTPRLELPERDNNSIKVVHKSVKKEEIPIFYAEPIFRGRRYKVKHYESFNRLQVSAKLPLPNLRIPEHDASCGDTIFEPKEIKKKKVVIDHHEGPQIIPAKQYTTSTVQYSCVAVKHQPQPVLPVVRNNVPEEFKLCKGQGINTTQSLEGIVRPVKLSVGHGVNTVEELGERMKQEAADYCKEIDQVLCQKKAVEDEDEDKNLLLNSTVTPTSSNLKEKVTEASISLSQKFSLGYKSNLPSVSHVAKEEYISHKRDVVKVTFERKHKWRGDNKEDTDEFDDFLEGKINTFQSSELQKNIIAHDLMKTYGLGLPKIVKSNMIVRAKIDEGVNVNLRACLIEKACETDLKITAMSKELQERRSVRRAITRVNSYLTIVYGAVFVTVFCGLNLTYSCA